MFKKLFFLFFLGMFISNAQQSLNDYKYVIVSKRFDFQKTENQYQLNDMAKFLFEKYNFNVVFEGDYPEDLYRNKCMGLKSNIVDESSMFVTKLKVELRNCEDKLLYTSEVGRSKRKEYRATYQEALRNAFKSFKSVNYQYNPAGVTKKPVTPKAPPVPETKKPVTPTAVSLPENEMNIHPKKLVKPKPEVIEKPIEKEAPANSFATLYAQPTSKGFQLVDTTPKVVFIIFKTSKDNLYLLNKRKGIFYREDNYWVAEYYQQDELVKEQYLVKF